MADLLDSPNIGLSEPKAVGSLPNHESVFHGLSGFLSRFFSDILSCSFSLDVEAWLKSAMDLKVGEVRDVETFSDDISYDLRSGV